MGCKKWLKLMLLFGFFAVLLPIAQAEKTNQQSVVTVLRIDGAIGPAVADYLKRGISQSEKMHAKAILLTVDTPGGLATSMRSIIKSILAAKIPVISYVYPSGAHAASAGTYILYASHIAAMAPGTNLGAATPVNMVSPKKNDKNKDKKNKDDAPKASASELKALNDAKAYIRSLAQLRKRNVEWAIKAVEKGESISYREALKLNVINFVAPSISALLKDVNGKTVRMGDRDLVIQLNSPKLVPINPDWRSKILHVITSPSVAYILLMIGVYGLFFEFMNPGYVVPGVSGAIALLLALYSFQMLPINYAGFILLILGVMFMVAEAFLPSFGALGFGGIIAFVLGSFLLFETQAPGFTLPWQLIIGVTVTTALFMIGLIQLLWRSRRKKVVSGVEGMIGQTGVIQKDKKSCWVIVGGERWHVKSDVALENKQTVTVERVDGLTLFVKPD